MTCKELEALDEALLYLNEGFYISDENKKEICKIYDSVVNWLQHPKTINGNSGFTFMDVVAICKAIKLSNQDLSNIINKKKNEFKDFSIIKFIKSSQMEERSVVSYIGKDNAKLVYDIGGDQLDYIIFAKNKLWWIQENHIDDAFNAPFDSYIDKYTDYEHTFNINILIDAIKDHDIKKKYYLLSNPPAGEKRLKF